MPMSIVLYKDKDGSTIPHSFITQLDPPPKGFEIIDSPYLTNDLPSLKQKTAMRSGMKPAAQSM